MSTLTITNAGLDYKNAVLAGTEQTNITHMLFAKVPGIDATTAPSVNSTIPAQHIVHSQTVERVSNLDGNALVISAILDYSIGDFEFNWFGAVATKSNGEQILVAVVHTHPQTKTKTDGPNVGDYSVKSIVWQSQQLGANVAVNIATQPWQVENDVFATINSSPTFKNATFDNGTSTTVNINADNAGMAALNVCSGTNDGAQATGRVYVGQSLKYGGGIEYNGDNTPITTGAGADFVALFRRDLNGLNWTARNHVHSNDWDFRGAVASPNFIEGGTSLKDKYHGKSDRLARFESSFIDATGQDFRIRNKRALVGFEDKLIINYASDWSHVDANGTWRFTGNIERNSHNSGYLVGSYNNVGGNGGKTNPVYTIGSDYQPSATELNNMFGIGYTHASSASFVPYEGGWGMYVAADGDARIFLDASHGRVHTTGDIYEAGTKLSDKYLGKTAKAADAAKLEGKTKAQVISEARTGLTKIDYQSDNFYDRSFRLTIPANSTVPFPDLPATACDILVFGSTDMTGTSTNFVGRFTKYGSTWSANKVYGSTNSTNHPSITVVNNQPTFKNNHGSSRYPFEYKCWIACQSNANAKPFEFFANAYSTQNKPSPADISDKFARFESSLIDTNGGQDLNIRNKRALVGTEGRLFINYGPDWQNVTANGKWQFVDSINTNGDITVTKNNPWLTLDSANTGNNNNEQAAGISVGESGRLAAASLHLSYTGDGYSYIGMGSLGPDNVADNWAMKMQYQSTWVMFRSALLIGDGNTVLSKGGGNSLKIKTNHGYVEIGPRNSGHCHYTTDRPSYHFNRKLLVDGEIYAGSGYNKRVLHEGNISGYAEKRTVKASGTLTANSKNHLTATATFTLPDVTNLSEGTTVVTSKAMAVTPTIKTHGAEHIAMMRGTTLLIELTSVLFDRHCTLTFILNSEKNWEMQ